MLFKPARTFINMHLVSDKKFDEKRLNEILNDMPEHQKLLIETVQYDDFEKYLARFTPMLSKKIGMTFDTAHIFTMGYKIEDLIHKIDLMPDLIHLNGNSTKFGSKSDTH